MTLSHSSPNSNRYRSRSVPIYHENRDPLYVYPSQDGLREACIGMATSAHCARVQTLPTNIPSRGALGGRNLGQPSETIAYTLPSDWLP